MAELSTTDINDLPDSDFAYIEDGGSKDSEGKTTPRDLRHFPIHDAAHVRNALSRAPQSPFGAKAMPKIKAAAEKFGIDTGSDDGGQDGSGRSQALPYTRSFELEDISVRSEGGGRVVEAYAAIFDQEAYVRDQDGEYNEVIDPVCFNRAIEHSLRSRKPVPVLFNHGMTLFHTPSERDSAPIGVAQEIKADRRGLFTRSLYHRTPRADEVLEGIRDGSITAYSFSGAFRRSDPAPPRGGHRKSRDGSLPVVRRMESTLREFGPATFPVYSGAEIVGVRAQQQLYSLLRALNAGTPLDPPPFGTPDDSGPATDDPPVGHSTRSNRERIVASYARFIERNRPRNV